MLLPMLAGALLHSQGIIEIELPEWLLAVAYMAIGWRIGLGFDRQVFLWRCGIAANLIVNFRADGDLRRDGVGNGLLHAD